MTERERAIIAAAQEWQRRHETFWRGVLNKGATREARRALEQAENALIAAVRAPEEQER